MHLYLLIIWSLFQSKAIIVHILSIYIITLAQYFGTVMTTGEETYRDSLIVEMLEAWRLGGIVGYGLQGLEMV